MVGWDEKNLLDQGRLGTKEDEGEEVSIPDLQLIETGTSLLTFL